MKLLVIQHKMIGDVLTSSILFEPLQEKYPNAQLDYLVNANTAAVVENHPYITNIIPFTKLHESNKSEFITFIKHIRAAQYDVVIDVYSVTRSNVISFFSGAKTRISYKKWYTKHLYTHTVERIKTSKTQTNLAIENRLQLLHPLGINSKPLSPKIYVTKAEKQAAKLYLKTKNVSLTQPIYMISLLGSSPEKSYPKNGMAKVLDHICNTQNNVQLIVNYAPHQLDLAKTIYNLCNGTTKTQLNFEVYGSNLREFLAITTFCKCLIGNEGGAINMAKALGLPTFTIFSPFICKNTWFGRKEDNNHVAVHLMDYEDYELKLAKKHPLKYYKRFKLSYILPKLNGFLNQMEHITKTTTKPSA